MLKCVYSGNLTNDLNTKELKLGKQSRSMFCLIAS